jgi:hypothetical protein
VLYLCNYYQVPLPLAIKSYLLLYPAVLIFLWSGRNWLDLGVLLSLGTMSVVILIGLIRLRTTMDKDGTHA